MLRSVTGEARAAVDGTRWSAVKDARVVPMLARILDESEPLGRISTWSSKRSTRWLASATIAPMRSIATWPGNGAGCRRDGRDACAERALGALTQIGTPAAVAAVDGVAKTGDWQLRRLARAAKNDGLMEPEELVRRFSATVRAAELYAPTHPIV